jgi:hypothetical protein
VEYREEVWSTTGEDACFQVNRELLDGQTRSRVRIGDIELLSAVDAGYFLLGKSPTGVWTDRS